MRGSLRSVRQRLARLGARAEDLAGTRRGALVLFVAALTVFVFEGIAWHVGAGRDLGTYLRYYLMMWESDPLFPQAILARTPVAPVVAGVLLDAGGGWLVEIAMALLYAGSIVAWSAAAAMVAGRRVTLATAVALLLYPSYGALFRELSTDALFAAGFAGWALLASRGARRPSPVAFALLGAGVAGLTLIRPSSQALLVAALLPLLLAGSWRRRAASATAFVAAAALGLLAWSAVNELRYDDFTVARGTQAVVPLFRAFATDRIVEPANGPASRELAAAVRRDLLPREPYRSYGIDLDEFFASGSGRMHEDLIGLSDRVFGWDSDYEVLGRVGREAVLSHPGTYARGVLRSFWQELHHPLLLPVGEPAAGDDRAVGGGGETIVVEGRRLPKPSEGQPIPAAHQSGFVSRPDGSAREVWTSPTEHHVAFTDPRDVPRYARLERRLDELLGRFPSRPTSAWLHERLNDAARVYPRSWLWLLVGIVALLVRRPAAWRLPVVLAGSGLVLLLATVLGVYAVPEYAVPVAPAFVLLACTGLFGPKRAPNASSTKAGATGKR